MIIKRSCEKILNFLLYKRSIRFQFIIGFLTFFLLIVTIENYFLYKQSTNEMNRTNIELIRNSMEFFKSKTTSILSNIEKSTNDILQNEAILNVLRETGSSKSISLSKQINITSILNTVSAIPGSPYSIRIFSNNGSVYDNFKVAYLPFETMAELKKQPFFNKLNQNQGEFFWLDAFQPMEDSTNLSVVGGQILLDPFTKTTIGYMLVSFDSSLLKKEFNQMGVISKGSIQIADETNHLVFSTEPANVRRYLGLETINYIWKLPPDDVIHLDKKAYFFYTTENKTGWKIICKIILKGSDIYTYSILYSGVTCVVLGLFCSMFLSSYITKPIRYLIKNMREIEKGNIQQYTTQIKGNVEVASLGNAFGSMVYRLQEVVDHLADKQISEREARMKNLNNQFNPHFLYNTLNIIYWKCIEHDQENIGNIVLKISDLLKYSILPGKELVPMEEDLKMIKNYLFILKTRYEDILEYSIQIEAGMGNYLIPRLLLQPLVENAVSHGLDRKFGMKSLVIRCFNDKDYAYFEVEDNGLGISEEELLHLNNKLRNEEVYLDKYRTMNQSTGLGLMNVQRRIHLIFGEPYGIHIVSSAKLGTKVTLKLPKETGEQYEHHYRG
jgi:two-component system sensor histidine kinase YesM